MSADNLDDDEFLSDDDIIDNHEYCHYNDSNDGEFSINILGHDIKLLQKPSAKDLGIGAVVWDSSVIFSKFVEHNRHDRFTTSFLSSKSVLELGCGCGLSGLTLMLRGCKVTFTDLPEVMKQLAIHNVTRTYKQVTSNGSKHLVPILEPKLISLDWTNFECEKLSIIPSNVQPVEDERLSLAKSATDLIDCPFDIVLLTDCVFSMSITEDLMRVIDLCTHQKSIVLCCYEIRDEATNKHFNDKFSELFTVKTIPKRELHPEYQSDLVTIAWAKKKRIR